VNLAQQAITASRILPFLFDDLESEENIYAYAGQNPTQNIDPLGLETASVSLGQNPLQASPGNVFVFASQAYETGAGVRAATDYIWVAGANENGGYTSFIPASGAEFGTSSTYYSSLYGPDFSFGSSNDNQCHANQGISLQEGSIPSAVVPEIGPELTALGARQVGGGTYTTSNQNGNFVFIGGWGGKSVGFGWSTSQH